VHAPQPVVTRRQVRYSVILMRPSSRMTGITLCFLLIVPPLGDVAGPHRHAAWAAVDSQRQRRTAAHRLSPIEPATSEPTEDSGKCEARPE
jgi:hypothetical protein